MILRPQPKILDISEIISSVGFSSPEAPAGNKREQFVQELNKNGASLSETAASLGLALTDEKTRVPASRIVLEAHGLINDKSAIAPPTINILVQNSVGATGGNILDLVAPR